MKRISIPLVLYAIAALAHAGPLEDCREQKNFGPACTRTQVLAADANADGKMEEAELRAYVVSGDLAYSQSRETIKSALNSLEGAGPVDSKLEEQLTAGLATATLNMIGPSECDPYGDEPCPPGWTTEAFIRHAQDRNVAWRPKRTLALPVKISRKATDPMDPRGGSDLKPRPFVVSYREDDIKDEKGLQLLGTISGPPMCGQATTPEAGNLMVRCGPVIGLDVDTFSSSKGKNNSDVSFGFNVEWLKSPREANDVTHRFSVTPAYLTDADFGRDVVTLGATYGVSTPKWGGPGHYHCLAAGECGPGTWEFVWIPAVMAQVGDIRDASGNAALEKRQALGSYVRVVPMLGLRLYGWDRRGAFGLDLAHVLDVKDGDSKSYGELSYTYDLASNVAITAIFRKGYKVQTLDEIDSLLLGFGFTF